MVQGCCSSFHGPDVPALRAAPDGTRSRRATARAEPELLLEHLVLGVPVEHVLHPQFAPQRCSARVFGPRPSARPPALPAERWIRSTASGRAREDAGAVVRSGLAAAGAAVASLRVPVAIAGFSPTACGGGGQVALKPRRPSGSSSATSTHSTSDWPGPRGRTRPSPRPPRARPRTPTRRCRRRIPRPPRHAAPARLLGASSRGRRRPARSRARRTRPHLTGIPTPVADTVPRWPCRGPRHRHHALEVDAIANAANTRLQHGGGVAGRDPARRRPGDPARVRRERPDRARRGRRDLRRRNALRAGSSTPRRWSSAARPRRRSSADATASTLAKADELGARSLALVAFGTGVGGFPLARGRGDRGRGGPPPPRGRLAARARGVRRPRRGAARRRSQAALAPVSRRGRRARGRGRRCGRHRRPAACTAGSATCSPTALRHGARRARQDALRLRRPGRGGASPLHERAPARGRPGERRAARRPRRRPASASGCWWRPSVGALVDLAAPGRAGGRGRPRAAGRPSRRRRSLLGFRPGLAPATSTSSSAARVRGPARAASTACGRRALALPARRARRRSTLREPIGAAHPLRVAEAVARLGGRAQPTRPRPRSSTTRCEPLLGARAAAARAARGPRPGPARRAADPPAPRRDGEVGRLPHRLRAPGARLRGQRPRARAGGRRGAAARGPARARSPRSASATST